MAFVADVVRSVPDVEWGPGRAAVSIGGRSGLEDYYWVAALVAFAFSFFFSMAAGALESFSVARFEKTAMSEKRRDRVSRCLERRDDMLFTCRLCGLCSRVVLVAAVVMWAQAWDAAAVPWAVLLLFVSVVFAGGLLPRHIASRSPEGFVGSVLPLLVVVTTVLSPAVCVLKAAERAVARLLGLRREPTSEEQIEEEILAAVHEGEMEGVIEEDEKEMIESIIEFKNLDAAEVMTPRTDMACLDLRATLEQARAFAIKCGFSRIPVIEEYRDNIVGMLYAKDLLRACGEDEPPALKDILRPANFVPETKKTDELLEQFQQKKVHMAIVLDEYGGVAGLVTIEDILEEIVGEIEDEFDTGQRALIRPLKDGGAEVSARARVSEVNEALGIDLPEDADYDTIGGLIFAKLAKIPRAGETLAVDNVMINILEADQRRIKRVGIKVRKA